MKKSILLLIVAVLVLTGGFLTFRYYPYLFAKNVTGLVFGVERVTEPTTVIGNTTASQMFSYAIAIKQDKTGVIFTGSSEDRQWAVVQKGQCAEARFFPYPPWELDKGGSYFGVRLIRQFECPVKD